MLFDIQKIEVKLLLAGILLAVGAAGGFFLEYKRYDEFQIKVKEAGDEQNKAAAAKDAAQKEDANVADKNTADAVIGIDDWYHKHPVVKYVGVPNNAGSSQLPGSNNGASGPNEANSTGPAGQYLSPYSPEETELVASQLDQLQKLLKADGVIVK